MGYS